MVKTWLKQKFAKRSQISWAILGGLFISLFVQAFTNAAAFLVHSDVQMRMQMSVAPEKFRISLGFHVLTAIALAKYGSSMERIMLYGVLNINIVSGAYCHAHSMCWQDYSRSQ
jgi:uncharacterized membrane protein